MNEELFNSLKKGECMEMSLDLDEFDDVDAKFLVCKTNDKTLKMKIEGEDEGEYVEKELGTIKKRRLKPTDFKD